MHSDKPSAGNVVTSMSEFHGFFQLLIPEHLLEKLGHDLGRIRAQPNDAYAAFDFFVTAEHMLDWLYPHENEKRTELRKRSRLLQTVFHLASGAKHFEATDRRHASVKDTEYHCGDFSDDFNPLDFSTDRLFVHLDGEAAVELGEKMDVEDLAKNVVDFWLIELPKIRSQQAI